MANWNLRSGYGQEELKAAAWKNASPLLGTSEMRLDCDGRYINWSEYGKTSAFGWQIDHIIPVSLGGSDVPSNVRARHYLGNTSAGGILGALLNAKR